MRLRRAAAAGTGVHSAPLQGGPTTLVTVVVVVVAVCWQCIIIAFVAGQRSVSTGCCSHAGATIAVSLPFANHSCVCDRMITCVCVQVCVCAC